MLSCNSHEIFSTGYTVFVPPSKVAAVQQRLKVGAYEVTHLVDLELAQETALGMAPETVPELAQETAQEMTLEMVL